MVLSYNMISALHPILSGGFSDYSHQFILDISKRDKEQIIKKITGAENFQPSLEDDFMLIAERMRYSEVDTRVLLDHRSLKRRELS